MAKFAERVKARELRKEGKSIKEITRLLNVSKSTASRWCVDIPLSSKQILLLREKMIAGGYEGRLKGAAIQRKKKLDKLDFYKVLAEKEIATVSRRDLLIFGLGLYLGEGNKNGNTFQFVNSNPDIIKAVVQWLWLLGIEEKDFYCNIIINGIHKERVHYVENCWSKIIKIPKSQFKKTVLIKTTNKKIYANNKEYLGTLILRVYKSSNLLYRVLGLMRVLLYKVIERV